MSVFKFKHFNIRQEKVAMKVGTDGVLLGAWVKIDKDIDSILDIGSGTGLIALQLAQRSDAETIDAVEIEPNAYEQTVENFENSAWNNRLFCYHSSFQAFADDIEDRYDLIVSNPPYFNSGLQPDDAKRSLARHTGKLTYKTLLQKTSKLLSEKGSCAFIIPHLEEGNFLNVALENNLHPQRITRVKGTGTTPIKRSLLQLSFKKTQVKTDALVIEISRHNYTEAYIKLVKDFYLKL